ncbi:hypothetical protein [Pseudomonas sp. Root329]|uniref:hypothetical protein n=1 Tax=Pseudomonas sp. Root329 TaxID=1736515 RepID=UPI001F1A1C7E|nr:hypothetical protein [Pseudomonas sp. Root329]
MFMMVVNPKSDRRAMAEGNIICGTFQSADKSGSALEAVLDALPLQARELVENVKQQLDTADLVLIDVDQAKSLLPFLQAYQAQLIAEIGNDDWTRATQEEESSLEPVAAKWGLGKGWRLYCVRDLIGACENALEEMEPVCIAFS